MTLKIEKNDEVGTNAKNGTNIGTNIKNGTNIGANIGTNEKLILDFISKNPTASSREISDALPVSLRTVQRCLTKLQDTGIIKNDGDRKKVKWIILK